jgi:sugar-specific transcriptional regulator TrmB
MLSNDQENLKILTSLGLTSNEAKIYFILDKIGATTIKGISTAARMDRPNVYGVVSRLQKLNLVEKMLARPIVFKAIPLNQGVPMLLEHKRKDLSELSTAAKKLIETCKHSECEAPSGGECQIMIIPKEKQTERKFEELFAHTYRTNEAICNWSYMKSSFKNFIPVWKNWLKRNVKIRTIFYLPGEEELPSSILGLSKKGSFEIRYMDTPPKIALSIYDEREAFLSTSRLPSESVHMWVNGAGFAAFFHDYFEMLWRNSTESKT